DGGRQVAALVARHLGVADPVVGAGVLGALVVGVDGRRAGSAATVAGVDRAGGGAGVVGVSGGRRLAHGRGTGVAVVVGAGAEGERAGEEEDRGDAPHAAILPERARWTAARRRTHPPTTTR